MKRPLLALVTALATLVVGCRSLPSLADRTESSALFDGGNTLLGRAVVAESAAHPAMSGIYPLRDPRDAFAARVLLAGAAERTLDVQYYIWRDDVTGRLMLEALLDAAKRGVRVRLLLDDNNTSGLDPTLAALAAQPNIEVRIFNPFAIRHPRLLGYLTDFPRLNRRMHNKSFTADNEVTIVGGRNIGDEYFDAPSAGMVFEDLDVIAVGPVVRDVSKDFDRYWASESSFPVDRLVRHATPAAAAQRIAALAEEGRDPEAASYREAIRETALVRQIEQRSLPMEWAPVQMVSDDPDKVLRRSPDSRLLVEQLKTIFAEPKSRIDLVSPYFVPGRMGTDLFRRWSKAGVKIRILTNALESNDVAAVHSGYAKRRKELLAAGVTLYELRRTPHAPEPESGVMGSSSSSLHAKTFAVDGDRVFVGSFNFDPRSARLNTEMGFVIDSANLARRIDESFDDAIPARSYQVHLSPSGDLYWTFQGTRIDTEPHSSGLRRFIVWLASRLPIEWLL